MPIRIYRLQHEYSNKKTEDGEPLINVKELGYFSSKQKSMDVVKRYKSLDGFKDYDIKCFKTKKFYLFIKANPYSIFELYHSYIDDKGYVEYNFIGIYASQEKAEAKKQSLIKKYRKYRDHMDGFEITEEVIDSENIIWNKGFNSFEDA